MIRGTVLCLVLSAITLAAAAPTPVTFSHPRQFPAGKDPNTAAIADFNHDGKPDVAVLSTNGSVSILLNNGNGFAAPATYAAGTAQGSMVVADLNQDGYPDIALVDGTGFVYVLYGRSDGGFHPAVKISLQKNPGLGIVAGDFNGDGIPDLAVAAGNYAGYGGLGHIIILPGQGHGAFGAPIFTTTRHPATALVAGDFNNDGKLDLAFDTELKAGPHRYALSVFLGNGDGTFGPPGNVLSDHSSTHLLVHDINGDGIEDIVDGAEVLYGNGDGTFQPPAVFPSEDGADSWIALADVNNDGHLDILSANSTGDISVSLGSGGGVFQQPYSYLAGTEPRWIGAANFLGHGFSDIVAIAEQTLELFPDTAGGKYGAESTIDLDQTAFGNPVLADFNGDGNPDAAVLSYGSSISILLGDGKGGFTPGTPALAGPLPDALICADFNGDGKPDLAVADRQTNLLYILLGNGDGTFSPGATLPLHVPVCPSGGCYLLAAADLNRDGKVDLVVLAGDPDSTSSALAQVFLGKGDGTFGEPLSILSALDVRQFAVGDFNGDGYPDLVFSNVQDGPVLFLGNGNGTFRNPLPLYTEGPSDIVAGDFTGNGKLDLAFTNPQGQLIVELGNGNATFQPVQTISQFSGGAITVADLNGDGHPDLFTSNSEGKAFTIYLGNGDGTFTRQTGPGITCVTVVGCGAAIGDVNNDGKPDVFAVQIGNQFAVSPIAVLINTTQ